ncbi:heat stress transcription factor A-1-like [Phalaenopsis equestris]|uniref:heat stress transcription factor A-1-like n=1 Tax=Phalaenopsis equestris TaxID=78828 RepID=UPI0009E55094|nr:heat stress transcription factor A-1-like [Phalaenopsis equestris]
MNPEKNNGSNDGGGAPLPSMFPPFLTKCYDMVNDPATDDTVCWGDSENTFIIKDQHTFSRDLLPKYFKHSNISSFIRQLNTYGFRKVDHDKWVFKNDGFVKGKKVLLKTITRKKSSHNNIHPQQEKFSSVKAVEVGQFGLEQEIERLKRDKNLLMQELVILRQHQQKTDAEINDLRQRLQGMELNQQQMLSFLAMAVQSPTFLSQLVQQNINGRWRSEMNKKRRLPAPAQQDGAADGLESSDKQIIKYEPSVMETSDLYVEEAELSPDPSRNSKSAFDGVNDLCADVDHISIGENSYKDTDGENTLDFSEYLEKLLASPVLENNGLTEQLYFDIPDFTLDFDFPVEDVEMETPLNTVTSGEISK